MGSIENDKVFHAARQHCITIWWSRQPFLGASSRTIRSPKLSSFHKKLQVQQESNAESSAKSYKFRFSHLLISPHYVTPQPSFVGAWFTCLLPDRKCTMMLSMPEKQSLHQSFNTKSHAKHANSKLRGAISKSSAS